MKNGYFKDKLGNQMWFKNNQFHRENGPAYISIFGHKYWYLNGLNHRIDGPAVEFADGKTEWYISSEKIIDIIYIDFPSPHNKNHL